MTFIQKDSKLDYEDNMVSPWLKAQSNSDASMSFTLHAPGNIFHFSLSLCLLTFRTVQKKKKRNKYFQVKKDLEFMPLPFEKLFSPHAFERLPKSSTLHLIHKFCLFYDSMKLKCPWNTAYLIKEST